MWYRVSLRAQMNEPTKDATHYATLQGGLSNSDSPSCCSIYLTLSHWTQMDSSHRQQLRGAGLSTPPVASCRL